MRCCYVCLDSDGIRRQKVIDTLLSNLRPVQGITWERPADFDVERTTRTP